MRSQVINWLKFTTMLASVIINRTIRPLTSADRATAFIIDDSMFRRTGYKSTELASKVFDHVDMKNEMVLDLWLLDGLTAILLCL